MRGAGRWACFAILALTCVTPAHAQDPVDLLTDANLRIDGATAGGRAAEVAGAGDVNGDGRSDVIVGGVFASAGHVVFGRASMGTVDLAALGSGGFRIAGPTPGDGAGDSVAGAGDVNGDGLADVVVGAPFAADGQGNLGATYVVFGKESSATVDLGALGEGGFRIGSSTCCLNGTPLSVGGGGDVNGDGLADVIVGTPFASFGRASAGSVYVIFGKDSSAPIDLSALGSSGFGIAGAAAFDEIGVAVADAGDVNGDGRADVVVGVPNSDQDGFSAGSAWVVFGKASGATVDLAALGAEGFRIAAAAPGDSTGASVAGAGDVNGDGRADVVIGAPHAPTNEARGAGFVVFGKASSSDVRLGALGSGGFRIDGAAPGDRAGVSVGAAGDVNGDGLSDVVLAAPAADNNGREDSGSAYLVVGAASTASVALGTLGERGFRIDGAAPGDRLGEGGGIHAGGGAGGAGDFFGDVVPDLIVGAPFADHNGRTDSGSAYVVSPPGVSTLAGLIELVRSFGLPPKTERSLVATLGAVMHGDQCGPLGAFLRHVRAQAGKKLTTSQAERLLRAAARVRTALSCPGA